MKNYQYILKDNGAGATYKFNAGDNEKIIAVSLLIVHPNLTQLRSAIEKNQVSIRDRKGTLIINNWSVTALGDFDINHKYYQLKIEHLSHLIEGQCEVNYNNWSHIAPPVGAENIVITTQIS